MNTFGFRLRLGHAPPCFLAKRSVRNNPPPAGLGARGQGGVFGFDVSWAKLPIAKLPTELPKKVTYRVATYEVLPLYSEDERGADPPKFGPNAR